MEYAIPFKRHSGAFKQADHFLMVDIVHLPTKLAIEVDGQSHKGRKQQSRDRWKERQLAALGWCVLRFSNREISADVKAAAEKIRQFIASK